MFDSEQFRKKVEEQLNNISEEKCIVFGIRSTMRVLPLLTYKELNNEAFGFWKLEDRNKYLLSIYFSYKYTIGKLFNKDLEYNCYSNTTYDAAAVVEDIYYFYIIRASAFITHSFIKVNVKSSVTSMVSGIIYALCVFNLHTKNNYSNSIIQETENDLILINKLTAEELLQCPLWSQTIPNEWQQLLNNFKEDVLSLNAGFEVWLDWYDDRLQGKPIDIELLKQWNAIPPEIEEQGAIAINAYLKNLVQKTAMKPLNRVRAIFIGYGEAGKTSLIRVLNDENVIEGQEDMTAGIAIRYWKIPQTDIEAHFWDFGGQVMAHATHQFFLRASCLYVLVLNARSEINSTEQAEYWLEHIKSFAGDAPVLIVGNKADNKIALNLDMAYLKEKYPNIIQLYSLS